MRQTCATEVSRETWRVMMWSHRCQKFTHVPSRERLGALRAQRTNFLFFDSKKHCSQREDSTLTEGKELLLDMEHDAKMLNSANVALDRNLKCHVEVTKKFIKVPEVFMECRIFKFEFHSCITWQQPENKLSQQCLKAGVDKAWCSQSSH